MCAEVNLENDVVVELPPAPSTELANQVHLDTFTQRLRVRHLRLIESDSMQPSFSIIGTRHKEFILDADRRVRTGPRNDVGVATMLFGFGNL